MAPYTARAEVIMVDYEHFSLPLPIPPWRKVNVRKKRLAYQLKPVMHAFLSFFSCCTISFVPQTPFLEELSTWLNFTKIPFFRFYIEIWHPEYIHVHFLINCTCTCCFDILVHAWRTVCYYFIWVPFLLCWKFHPSFWDLLFLSSTSLVL
jgi:hypothetical protein